MPEPKWAHPEAIEREYTKTLKQYARRCQRACNELLMPEVPRLVEMADMRSDALGESEESDEGTWADRLNEILGTVLAALLGRRAQQVFEGMAGPASASDVGVAEFGERVSRFNLRQFVKLVRRVYGEPYAKAEPDLDKLMRAWELENLKLIRSIPERYVDDLQGAIIRAINEGQSATDLRDTIRATYDKPVNRAQLIANDQIGKLNGRLTQYRQQAIGIDEYYWRGVLDWRERAHHRRRERKAFKWSKPPWDGHPGQPIHCRCWASPKWPPRDEVTLQ
ncbi:phage minor head protein [Halomonas elongata]|uniref:phage minor head protein n=1 Tax=Halomonas elongata TaxID=2746 RepID=UPI002E2C373A|nr:phage minor head protein [Halomonas elongata]WVI72708.1 phage minor head protein [Halomonas elongata]